MTISRNPRDRIDGYPVFDTYAVLVEPDLCLRCTLVPYNTHATLDHHQHIIRNSPLEFYDNNRHDYNMPVRTLKNKASGQ